MKIINTWMKVKMLFVFAFYFLCINFTLVYVERIHLDNVATTSLENIQNYRKLLALKFEQHKKYMSYENKQSDILSEDQKNSLLNKINLSFLSDCSISVQQSKAGEKLIHPLPNQLFNDLSFDTRLQLLEMCEAVVELEVTNEQLELVGENQHVVVKIPEPVNIINDKTLLSNKSLNESIINNNEQNVSWIVSSREMSILDYVNSDYTVWNVQAVSKVHNDVYYPQVWTKHKPLHFEQSLFFGNINELFNFSNTFSEKDVTSMFTELTNINKYVEVNVAQVIKHAPYTILFALISFYFFYRLNTKLSGLKLFLATLNMTGYSLIKFDLVADEQSILLSNVLKQSKAKSPYQYNYFDKALNRIESLAKAEYVHVVNEKETHRFSVTASTFMRENQMQGNVLLIESGEAQDNIKRYETIYKIDALTQLPNRTELQEVIEESQRSGTCYLMAIIDLDHFKKVNDTFGHHFGDLVLQHSADHLRRSIKLNNNDHIIRLGGEEFIILIETSDKNFVELSQSIARRIIEFNQDSLSFSGGIIYWDPNAKPYDSAYKHCDKLLYAAKENGRHQVKVETTDQSSFTVSDIPEFNTGHLTEC